MTLWCVVRALMVDALAGPLERVEFEGASQPGIRSAVISGDRIQGYLAKPEGAGPFPAVIALHGCAGMPDTTKRKLADELIAWGYVISMAAGDNWVELAARFVAGAWLVRYCSPMAYVIELYREGALLERPPPYDIQHLEDAKHFAARRGRTNNADFVRVLDDTGQLELWSERLDV